ncbi:hypothetical protein ACFTAO_34925 [Paenibacillus rhizoplanae]
MAYTRGNLAVQPKRKETANPLYREKTKVVTRRRVLPLQEKLLYMLTLGAFILVAASLIWRYVHIYDLNMQAQKLDSAIANSKKTNCNISDGEADAGADDRPAGEGNGFCSPF